LVHNEGNSLLSIGGDGALRGYPAGAFQGEHVAQANVEWRSSPIRILTARIGMVVFVDGASSWYTGDEAFWHGSAGLGLRVVIPALSTVVRAGDLAFPFEQTTARYAPVFSLGMEQIF
jgi:hemolysin activation/secretion protein